MKNKILKIFNDDQKDRRDPKIRTDFPILTKNDRIRKKMVENIIRTNKSISARDYYYAAMIYHHGSSIRDSITAVKLSKMSSELGYRKALLLYATCLDRLLIKQGRKQKFGTQYRKMNPKSKWKMLPFNSKTTDTERKRYGVVTLKELNNRIKKLNA